ncbi:hypothetical protein Cgig2_022184 [Carnegiea gigantea]|uniref:Transcription repressor n=1 Tax=Carnegiea gigantea TaxID=171969 RepID=A0A9Q1JLZ9_9CARY|nr:hypothetical protein Cgig2_022184 [Carnegiea gigantea]
MKLPFLSRSKSLDPKLLPPSSPWTFPSGGHVKTPFFRGEDDTAFRTFNSTFVDNNSSSSRSFSTLSDGDIGEPVEAVIQGLRSDRFFFEPEQSSLLVKYIENKVCSSGKELEAEENRGSIVSGYKESEMLWVDSSNPYEDFKRSMEDIVVAYGLMRDWDGLEELLGCYLKINGKNNHGKGLAYCPVLGTFN